MGKNLDMVNGSLGDKIIKYTIPLAATGILQQLFNAADIAVVGRYAGKEAMAAVGSNSPVIGLLVNLFVGISLGSNVIIAKSIGKKNNKNVSKSVHTSIIVALLGGLCMTLIGELLASDVIRLCYIFFAYTFSFVQEVMSGYLRGYGFSFIPALCSVVGICGVRLVWIFTVFRRFPSFETIMQIYPISLGITAAAILTVTLIIRPSAYFQRINLSER